MNKIVSEKQSTNLIHGLDNPADVREAKIRQDQAHRKALDLKTKSVEAWRTFKSLRNKANSILRTAKASYYSHLADDNKN